MFGCCIFVIRGDAGIAGICDRVFGGIGDSVGISGGCRGVGDDGDDVNIYSCVYWYHL